MKAGIAITVSPEDRKRLEALARYRNAKAEQVARAKVKFATADRCGTMAIMRRLGLSNPGMWRGQERFIHAGVDGLLRDKTWPSGKPRLPDAAVHRVLDLTLSEPPRGGHAPDRAQDGVERVKGIEPSSSAWKADIVPSAIDPGRR
jgi:hypothetical protein